MIHLTAPILCIVGLIFLLFDQTSFKKTDGNLVCVGSITLIFGAALEYGYINSPYIALVYLPPSIFLLLFINWMEKKYISRTTK